MLHAQQASAEPQLAQAPSSSRLSRDPKEWQADYFAACLLMPAKFVRSEWQRIAAQPAPTGCEPCNEMARRFEVSEEAMWIRLEGLGLLGT